MVGAWLFIVGVALAGAPPQRAVGDDVVRDAPASLIPGRALLQLRADALTATDATLGRQRSALGDVDAGAVNVDLVVMRDGTEVLWQSEGAAGLERVSATVTQPRRDEAQTASGPYTLAAACTGASAAPAPAASSSST
jgi:hypothetical protein